MQRMRGRRTTGRVGCLLVVALAVAGCGDDDAAAPTPRPVATPTAAPTTSLDIELRAELVGMLERDQAQRTGRPIGDETDDDRTRRLKEIVAEHGWPGYDLVGEEGEEAAWAIAQHSDTDPAFQAEALDLLRAAVEAGQASPGNLAYLTDRVAVGQGRPQTYGTQVGCTPSGPEPATPIEDPDAVEDLREQAGLETLEEYLAEMTELCAADG